MKVINWVEVEESRPSTMLEPGGYVIKITDINDVPSREYMWVVYDVVEGDQAGIYANLSKDDDWKHRFTRSYKETAQGMFKAFLARLEDSNEGFSIERWQRTSDERGLIGLKLGIVLQTEQYTNDKGEDKERTVVVGVESIQDIRSGNFYLPAPKDRRESVEAPKASDTNDAYDDIPFM